MKNLVDCHFCGGTGVVESLNNRILCEECLGSGYLRIETGATNYRHYKEMLEEHQNNLNSVEHLSKASLEALYADLHDLSSEMLKKLESSSNNGKN